MEKSRFESFEVFSCLKKVNPRILSTFKRSFSKKMGKKPSSHIIHSLGGEYCWIVRDSEPIRLLNHQDQCVYTNVFYDFVVSLALKHGLKETRKCSICVLVRLLQRVHTICTLQPAIYALCSYFFSHYSLVLCILYYSAFYPWLFQLSMCVRCVQVSTPLTVLLL